MDLNCRRKAFLLSSALAYVLMFGITGRIEAQSSPQNAVVDSPGAEASAQLEEVVVTARRREETLQSVPVAVTVLSAQGLKNGLATDLSNLAELVPQMSINQGGVGTGAVITIRGISSSSIDGGLDQSVLIDMDGIPLSRGQVVSTSLYDIKSVQVMPGPQALFFGKNSAAGVVSIQSADPTDKYEGYVSGAYEFVADEKYIEGAVNVPIDDTLQTRLAFHVSQMNGWMRNVATAGQDPLDPTVTAPGALQHSNGQENLAARLGVLWAPTADFDAKLKIDVDTQNQASGNANGEGFCVPPQTTPTVANLLTGQSLGNLPGVNCAKDQVISSGDVPAKYAVNIPYADGGQLYARSNYVLGSLDLDKQVGELALTSTTGYFYQTYREVNNSDLTPFATVWTASGEAYRLFTEELRANSSFDGPVNGTAGVYYEHFTRPFINTPSIDEVFNPIANNYATAELDAHNVGYDYSAFGELRWDIQPNLVLSAGARYTHDSEHTDMGNIAVGPVGPAFGLLPVGQQVLASYSSNNVSPQVTLTWHPERHQTLYASFKTGYKAGGISNPLLLSATYTGTNSVFKPEKTDGFEIGYKADLLDNTLRVDLDAYRYSYDDLQVSAFDAQTTNFFILNAANARVQGLEGATEWLATDKLTFRGNFGFNDATYVSFPSAECYAGETVAQGCQAGTQNLAGKPLVDAPRLTFSLGADYKVHMGNWQATLSATGNHTGEYNADASYSPGGVQSSFWILDASARVGPNDGKYELAIVGRNLTNSYYMLQTYGWTGGSSNQYLGFFNRPREVELVFNARF